MVRYESAFRRSEDEIGKILVPARDGTMVPIKELADIHTITGPLIIYRDNHTRFCAVKFSVRGRDMGTAVAEAQQKVDRQVKLPEGYTLKWTGDFENQQRATKRLAQVVPVSIAIIFVILFVLFGNARDAGLVLLNVPYAAVGRGCRPSAYPFQLFDFGRYRFYRAIWYLYPERGYHDFRYKR